MNKPILLLLVVGVLVSGCVDDTPNNLKDFADYYMNLDRITDSSKVLYVSNIVVHCDSKNVTQISLGTRLAKGSSKINFKDIDVFWETGNGKKIDYNGIVNSNPGANLSDFGIQILMGNTNEVLESNEFVQILLRLDDSWELGEGTDFQVTLVPDGGVAVTIKSATPKDIVKSPYFVDFNIQKHEEVTIGGPARLWKQGFGDVSTEYEIPIVNEDGSFQEMLIGYQPGIESYIDYNNFNFPQYYYTHPEGQKISDECQEAIKNNSVFLERVALKYMPQIWIDNNITIEETFQEPRTWETPLFLYIENGTAALGTKGGPSHMIDANPYYAPVVLNTEILCLYNLKNNRTDKLILKFKLGFFCINDSCGSVDETGLGPYYP